MGDDDDWDPFAVADADTTGQTPEEAAKELAQERAADKPAGVRILPEDIDWICNQTVEHLHRERPWARATAVEPDILWHTPTYDCENWGHHDVLMQVGNGIAYVIFNRPEENNTMQDTLGAGINDALMALHARPDIRLAVWTGEGRMYCAGGDPKGWQALAAAANAGGEYTGDGTVGVRVPMKPPSDETNMHLNDLAERAFKAGAFPDGNVNIGRLQAAKQWHTWAMLPQFTICLLNGSAMGGGVGCVCCCDYVISVKKAYLVLSEVKIGVIPATISPYVIAKIGIANSKRLFCCAENLTAERAKSIGMVQEVVETMRLGHDRVKEIADMIAECGPNAVVASKRIITNVNGAILSEAVAQMTCGVQTTAAESEEYRHGLLFEQSGTLPPWKLSPMGYEKWPDNAVGLGKGKKT